MMATTTEESTFKAPQENSMNNKTAFANLIQNMLAARGYEEIIGPLGPLVAQQFDPTSEPWKLGQSSAPWRVAVPQLIAAVQARDLARRLEGRLQDTTVKNAT